MSLVGLVVQLGFWAWIAAVILPTKELAHYHPLELMRISEQHLKIGTYDQIGNPKACFYWEEWTQLSLDPARFEGCLSSANSSKDGKESFFFPFFFETLTLCLTTLL